MWEIEYENRVNSDDGFSEWYEVENPVLGIKYKADNQAQAQWLCNILNWCEETLWKAQE